VPIEPGRRVAFGYKLTGSPLRADQPPAPEKTAAIEIAFELARWQDEHESIEQDFAGNIVRVRTKRDGVAFMSNDVSIEELKKIRGFVWMP
jgi:hypothetical protein